MMRIQIYAATLLATLAVAACDASSSAAAKKEEPAKSAAPVGAKPGPEAVAEQPEPDKPTEAEAKAAEEAEVEALVADLIGEDGDKREAAREALEVRGEKVVPYLALTLVEKCKEAQNSGDKMWGAHKVMKKILPLISMLGSYMGESGKEALRVTLGEKDLHGWGASFQTVCAAS